MNNNKLYQTEDLFLCVTLTVFGFHLESIEINTNSQRASFVFHISDDLLKTIENYWKQQLSVEPQRLFQSYRLVRNRLQEAKRDI